MEDGSPAGAQAHGRGKPTGHSWFAVAGRAVARWGATVLAYAVVGTAVSWLSYAWFVWELRAAVPANSGVGHSILLSSPVVILGVLFLVLIPGVLIVIGNAQGMQAALKGIVKDRRDLLLKVVMGVAWPACQRLSAAPAGASASAKLRALMEVSEEKGASRRVLRWGLRAAHVPKLLGSAELLSAAKERPEEAEKQLVKLIEQHFDDLLETSTLQLLWIACGILLAVALASPVWVSWFR